MGMYRTKQLIQIPKVNVSSGVLSNSLITSGKERVEKKKITTPLQSREINLWP